MSGNKQTSNKIGKKRTDQQDTDTEKDDLRRKRAAYSHPLASDEPVYKKSKHLVQSKFSQSNSSSSGSDDDDSDDEDSTDDDDVLSGNILNSSSQIKDKHVDDDSDGDSSGSDDDSSDDVIDGNEVNSSSLVKDKNNDDDSDSDSSDSDDVLDGNKFNNSSKVNELNNDDDNSDEDDDSDDDDESDSDNDKPELSTKSILPGTDKRNEKVSESEKNQDSIIENKNKATNSSDEDSDDDISSESEEDDNDDEDDKNIDDDTIEKDTGDGDVESNSEDELEAVKKELANIPLEDLMKIKEKLGLKVFNKIMHGDQFNEKKKKEFKRENKNRPMEMSSKRKVSIFRQTDVPKEKVKRDPRFDDLSGEYQDKHFTNNYAFLSDVKAKEKLLIQKKMKKTKDENKKQELSKLLNRMTQQEQVEETKRKRMELEKQWKEKERELIKEGKTPYFLKKSDKKKLELAEKFKELQKSGQIDKYMGKRLKKNAQKEKKKLPGRHQRMM